MSLCLALLSHFNPGTSQPAPPQRPLPPGPTLKLLLCKEHSGPEEVAGLMLSPFTSPRKGVKGVLAAGQDTRLLDLQTCGGVESQRLSYQGRFLGGTPGGSWRRTPASRAQGSGTFSWEVIEGSLWATNPQSQAPVRAQRPPWPFSWVLLGLYLFMGMECGS